MFLKFHLFSLSSKYLFVIRCLSANSNKMRGDKISLKYKFKHKDFFQDSFRSTGTENTGGGSSKSNDQNNSSRQKNNMNFRKPVEFGYQGEVIFGIHPVYLALKEKKRQFFQLFLKKEFITDEDFSKKEIKLEIECLAKEMNIPVKKMSKRDLDFLVPYGVHQGVCMDASVVPLLDGDEMDLELQSASQTFPLWAVLDSIQDPMNFGAVLRSSYFFGVDRIITVPNNSCRLSPTVSKASSGAMEVMNIYCISDLKNFIIKAKSCGWCVVSTAVCDPSHDSKYNAMELSQFSMTKPTLLILGNEARGVSSEVQNLCDVLISIDSARNTSQWVDSLNVSVATGIILHHMKNTCSLK